MPEWVDPVAHYMIHEGLPTTLRLAAYAVVGSTLIGVLLGTLLTIRFWPLQALIRLYVEVWRGLPILITIFIVYFALPTAPVIHHRFGAITRCCDRLDSLGERSGRGGDPRGCAVDPEGAARGRSCAWLRLDRPTSQRDPAAGPAAPSAAVGEPARQHHPEHDDRVTDRRHRAACYRATVDRAAPVDTAR